MTLLSLKNVIYSHKETKKTLLDKITVAFIPGKIYCILGKNGVEKRAFLSLVAGLDVVESGEINFENQELRALNRDEYRAKKVGSIFQTSNLIQEMTAIDNLQFCTIIAGGKKKKEFFYERLKKVGITSIKANQKIKKLSQADQQKVFLAKLVINDPKLLIIDEPLETLSDLPLTTVMDYLRVYVKSENKCLIISSQSTIVAKHADELWGLNGGKLSFIKEQRE